MIAELVVMVLLAGGAFFVLVAALGVLRFPDVLLRMHASTKAGTLGVGLIVVATMVYYGDMGSIARGLAIVVFVLLTAPVAAHMMGRAAYLAGTRLWDQTFVDQFRKGKRPPDRADSK
jgi:multicomponent Na+:H+ antiporter subunit G